jgi:hypothetical protein
LRDLAIQKWLTEIHALTGFRILFYQLVTIYQCARLPMVYWIGKFRFEKLAAAVGYATRDRNVARPRLLLWAAFRS